MNYFAHQSAAERYARGRPYFHPVAVDIIQQKSGLDFPVRRALDVGCGTGQSAVALKPLAKHITGAEVSEHMLAQCPDEPDIQFVQASGEDLPAKDRSIDLVTICMAFHWVDQERFLAESTRVLKPGGVLAVYNCYFCAEMEENSDFNAWAVHTYFKLFPSPFRGAKHPDADMAQPHGLHIIGKEAFEYRHVFTTEDLALYFTTQSNVCSQVEGGTKSWDEVNDLLLRELTPLMPDGMGTFLFQGEITLLKSDEQRNTRPGRSQPKNVHGLE